MQLWIGRGADLIEAIAVTLIVGYIIAATVDWLIRSIAQGRFSVAGDGRFRAGLGRALLLGLEILVAADIVRTAAMGPTLTRVLALAILVVVRTFLSWSIRLETNGGWPLTKQIPRPATSDGNAE